MSDEVKSSRSVEDRLRSVQQALKVPKTETGRFGKHRNVEGILEAAKPHLKENGLMLLLDSAIQEIGGRNYVVATATVYDQKGGKYSVQAYAWEGEISRGLDAPQVTGAATSYARKYALGGLLAIDDGKDDPDSHKEPPPAPAKPSMATGSQKFELQKLMKTKGIDEADQMTLFVETVINKPKVETEADYQKIKEALQEVDDDG